MFRIHHRRRREQKTNFKKRLALVKPEKTRLVIRKSLSGVQIQFINYNVNGDKTVTGAITKELKKLGWSGATKNVPTAYLTGLLAGKKAKQKGINDAILDMGLQVSTKGSRIYAALKGVIDAGIDVPHDPEVLPGEERITGVHVVEAYKHFKELKNDSYMFSELEQNKVKISAIPKQFEEVKKTLLEMSGSDLKKKKTAAPAKTKEAEKKPKRAKPARKAPRATPKKPKPKKLVARGKKSKKSKKKK